MRSRDPLAETGELRPVRPGSERVAEAERAHARRGAVLARRERELDLDEARARRTGLAPGAEAAPVRAGAEAEGHGRTRRRVRVGEPGRLAREARAIEEVARGARHARAELERPGLVEEALLRVSPAQQEEAVELG